MDKPLLYPIGAVARLTGITVDTLRIWERRYGAVTPVRDERGRLYTDADIQRLRQLADGVARGHSIGRLARLSPESLTALLAAQVADSGAAARPFAPRGAGDAHLALLSAVERFDAAGLDRELSRLSIAMSPRDLVHRVVLPLMAHVGEEWHAGRLTAGQEHLISAGLRSLLGGLVRIAGAEHAPRRLLFATPPGDRHEFGILAAAMLAAVARLGTVYLGPDLPAVEIVDAATRGGVHVVVLGVVYGADTPDVLRAIDDVAVQLPQDVELWIGGTRPSSAWPTRAMSLPDFVSYEAQLARVGGRV